LVAKAALDFSLASLRKCRAEHDSLLMVCADANHIPIRSGAIDLVIATDELI
jgi:hypothetical protein